MRRAMWRFFFPPGRGGSSAPAALRLPVLREARPLPDEGMLRVGDAGEPPLPHRSRLHHHRLQRESCGELQPQPAGRPAIRQGERHPIRISQPLRFFSLPFLVVHRSEYGCTSRPSCSTSYRFAPTSYGRLSAELSECLTQ